MTINGAYLVALRATVTLTYIPVMTPGLYDTFPGPPETFPGHPEDIQTLELTQGPVETFPFGHRYNILGAGAL